jgi:hypothetical protein
LNGCDRLVDIVKRNVTTVIEAWPSSDYWIVAISEMGVEDNFDMDVVWRKISYVTRPKCVYRTRLRLVREQPHSSGKQLYPGLVT